MSALPATSGRINGVLWFSRQLTGTPYVFRGYVDWGEGNQWCGHNHRKAVRARACARSLARSVSVPVTTPNCPNCGAQMGVETGGFRCDPCELTVRN